MGALVLIIMGRLPVSVYQHTVVTSVRMVSTLAAVRWTLVKSGLRLITGVQPPHCWSPPRLSFVLFSDLERCEPSWDKFQGFCYRHFSQRLSWEVAEQHCRMLGAHLVSVMSPEEQTYINSKSRSCCTAPFVWKICWAHLFLSSPGNYKEYQWTGLNDKTIEDDFRWSDGNPLVSNPSKQQEQHG